MAWRMSGLKPRHVDHRIHVCNTFESVAGEVHKQQVIWLEVALDSTDRCACKAASSCGLRPIAPCRYSGMPPCCWSTASKAAYKIRAALATALSSHAGARCPPCAGRVGTAGWLTGSRVRSFRDQRPRLTAARPPQNRCGLCLRCNETLGVWAAPADAS